MEVNPILIAGCGPGSPDYVTPAARRAVESAQVLVGARRLLDTFPGSAAERIAAGSNIDEVLDAIAARREKRIAVLVTGDPGLCSLARPVLKRFGRASCRIIPGISSVQAAFAAIGFDWQGARVLSAHDTPPALDPISLAGEAKLAVLAGNPAHAAWTGALVRALVPTHAVFLCEDLTLPGESVRRIESQPMKLASRSILLFIRKEIL